MKSLLLGILILISGLRCAIAGDERPQGDAVHQLRIYEIFDRNKQGFHDRFRDHAARIMGKHGFRIVSMWETRFNDKTEFVYLIEWPDRDTMAARWADFMKDDEWIEIKRETAEKYGPLVGEIQDRTLEPTPYSPRKSFFP